MENEVRLRWKQLGSRILQASRNELYLSMRFLDVAFGELTYEMDQSTFFMGTDGVSIRYNARFLAEKYEYDRRIVNRAYLHMVLHCLFRHMYHREEREEELWNLSCEIAVEYIIDHMDFACVKQLVTDRRQEVYDRLNNKLSVLTAEGIYRTLMEEEISDRDKMQLTVEFLVDDHAFWQLNEDEKENNQKQQEQKDNQNSDSNDENKDQQKNQSSLNEQAQQREYHWKEVSEKTETNLETFSKSIGDDIKELMTGMKVTNRERYDYREFLKKFAVLTERIQVDEDSFDYAFYTYGMDMYDNIPLIEPLEYKESLQIEEFVIAIDTSGSCSQRLVSRFLEETWNVLKSTESFSHKLKLHIIQCDNEVKEDIVIDSLEQLEQYMDNFTVKGFGGTDFRPVFDYVEALRQEKKLTNLKGLLYFTDGFGIYPKKRTDYETAFVFIKEDYTDADIPSWAIKLILSPEDLMLK